MKKQRQIIREISLLEVRNNELELMKDRKIGVEDRNRQHATKIGTIPKSTICSIDIFQDCVTETDKVRTYHTDTTRRQK